MSPRQLIDAGVLGGLVLALLLVVLVDKLMPTPAATIDTTSAPVTTVLQSQPGRAKPLRLAVTKAYEDKVGAWDDMAKLLAALGAGYPYTLISKDRELDDPKRFEAFDVLFLTCAPFSDKEPLASNLRNFVGKGGTLYASDWRYDCIALAFPDMVANNLRAEGRAQMLDAQVVDAGLRDLLGATVPLKFDLDRWKPAAFGSDRVQVLLRGTYQRQTGGIATAPLLVKFKFGEGTVIFTSFHNEKQNSEIEQKLLKYLVFSAVTAQIENQINRSLIQGGFKAQKQNLLSASRDQPTVTYQYRSTKAGKIRFDLGFEDRGAELKLTITTPEKKTIERQGTSSFAVELPSAGPAEWRYTVTAVRRPFDEFPFTVTVSESE
jgi:hypothetical protein